MKNKLTPIKAIHLKCLECAGRPKDVRHCENLTCPCHQYRLGTNPNRKGIGGKKAVFDPKKATLVDNNNISSREVI